MADEITPDEEKAIEAITEHITGELMKGKKPKKLIKFLVKNDWEEPTAIEFVTTLEKQVFDYKASPEGRATIRKEYTKLMGFGVLWVVGGVIVTVVSYNAAKDGGTYLMTWGAVIFGLYDIVRGLIGWFKYRPPEEYERDRL